MIRMTMNNSKIHRPSVIHQVSIFFNITYTVINSYMIIQFCNNDAEMDSLCSIISNDAAQNAPP